MARVARSSNGRTPVFGAVCLGSSPNRAAILPRLQSPAIIGIITLSLKSLQAHLPQISDTSLSVEDQARCVLHLLGDFGEDVLVDGPSEADCRTCPNCGELTTNLSSPYCSENCKSQASFVRQLRAAIASGSILEPEKQTVFGERLWWLLGGGLPMRESRIPESAKRQVIKRCGGDCEFCGKPMSTIQKFGSGCNRPLHLRAACSDCAKTKPFCDPEFSSLPESQKLLKMIASRVSSDLPLRPCDDPNDWNWREFLNRRRNH